ncbi:hypothetical protein [Methylobacterium sp. A52T]
MRKLYGLYYRWADPGSVRASSNLLVRLVARGSLPAANNLATAEEQIAALTPYAGADFSVSWYGLKADPVRDYLVQSWREGRDPRPDCSSGEYLARHPHLARAGINQFLNFIARRRAEPDLAITVRLHLEPERAVRDTALPRPGRVRQVAVLGAISATKGGLSLQALAMDAQDRKLPLPFSIVGFSDPALTSSLERTGVSETRHYSIDDPTLDRSSGATLQIAEIGGRRAGDETRPPGQDFGRSGSAPGNLARNLLVRADPGPPYRPAGGSPRPRRPGRTAARVSEWPPADLRAGQRRRRLQRPTAGHRPRRQRVEQQADFGRRIRKPNAGLLCIQELKPDLQPARDDIFRLDRNHFQWFDK